MSNYFLNSMKILHVKPPQQLMFKPMVYPMFGLASESLVLVLYYLVKFVVEINSGLLLLTFSW